MSKESLIASLRTVPDYPKKGILFWDVTTLFKNPAAFKEVEDILYEEKDPDDLTPSTKRNVSYEELKKTWMAKMNENCIFISAKNRDNYQEFRDLLYKEIRDMHAIRYPYDNFLY